ncbi:helix-turn-helix domain-containing protein [Bacillus sp. BRMEA1]|uniref:helix-turn-helix domain-containing protein n=1 Tax=Neobacillus endophyticus TaxID=2738405 RepID=UPI001565CD0E|nr:helix-turn-helix domain-containing protein [Neobacillus endophyticus]NRD81038.1 helix-turn-helix domain-containing protein [Neobacillus endophyticus]
MALNTLKYRRKLTNKQRVNIIKRYEKGDISLSDLAKKYNVSKTTIWKIVKKSENKILIDEIRDGLHETTISIKNNIKNIERLSKIIDESKLSKEELEEYGKIINLISPFEALIIQLEVVERINKSTDMKRFINLIKNNKR